MGDRGSGGSSKGSGSSQYSLSYGFELFELKDDGTPTTFTGAIENFKGSFVEQNTPIFDPTKTPRDKRFSFFLDNPSGTITFPDQDTNLAASFDQNSIKYKIAPTTYQYTDNSNNTKSGTVELEFVLTDDDNNPDNGFQADVKDENGEVKTVNVEIGQATSSIKYIASEGLLGSVDTIAVSGKNSDGNTFSVGLAGGESATFTQDNPTGNPTGNPSTNGDDVLTGDNGDNTLDGGEGNNVLRGQEGNDVLTSGAGSDNLDGGNGDDDLSSGGGNDILTGGAGSDLFDCGDGNDTVDGGDGNDDIFGAGGDDLIRGGNGDDILTGGAGLDVLVGDGGADIFAVSTLGGADIIRDFNYGQDLIGLSDGITFEDLIVTQGDGAAILSYQDQAIASISGGTPGQINASLFTEI